MKAGATLSFTIAFVPSLVAARLSSRDAKARASAITGRTVPSLTGAVDTLSGVGDHMQPICEAVYPFLDKIQAFVQVVDRVSDVCPLSYPCTHVFHTVRRIAPSVCEDCLECHVVWVQGGRPTH